MYRSVSYKCTAQYFLSGAIRPVVSYCIVSLHVLFLPLSHHPYRGRGHRFNISNLDPSPVRSG
jgi:hypothetical protein